MILIGFDEYEPQCRALAAALDATHVIARVHRFPDGESRLALPDALPEQVAIVRSLDFPNDKLVELMLAAATARELGARALTLVAPYLCYMRQDLAFRPGEAVSQRIVGRFLAGLFDRVVTVDPHLHRTPQLDLVVPARRVSALTATRAMGDFLGDRLPQAFIVGPDAESGQWAQAVAIQAGLEYAVARKTRSGDRKVEIQLPPVALEDRVVVLVDDICSTGRTLAAAARLCLARGAASVDAFVIHALFVGDALEELRRAGVREVWSTDSVTHASNVIGLAPLIAAELS